MRSLAETRKSSLFVASGAMARAEGTAENRPSSQTATYETRVNCALALGIGLLLAVLTLRTEYAEPRVFSMSRVVPVDLVCTAFLAVLFLRHRMAAPPWPALLYVAAVVLSLVPGLVMTGGGESKVCMEFLARLMAFCFYLAGLNIGASGTLIRWLIGGLCMGVFAEAVVVVHDAMGPSQWFPDPMDGRVRGTFKANGQLGAYGFCAAGLLATFGVTLGAPLFRRLCVIAAPVAASFVFFASRRTGMISVAVWGVVFAVLAWRFAGERFYKAFVGALLATLVLLAAFWDQASSSFAGRRLASAMESLDKRESFLQDQLRDTIRTVDQWFPFGFGVGLGSRINAEGVKRHEVHNGLLAVLVELGVFGLLGFLGMSSYPLLKRRWHQRSRDHELLGVLLTTTLVASFIFMIHNTLFRDRTFLLYLGIATAIAQRESLLRGPSGLFPNKGEGA
ncbi:MAG: hypothetical protein HY716_18480 [Planctomycetes bacterium]|nr:hypothetical protein [Planctomycetota bacterium]